MHLDPDATPGQVELRLSYLVGRIDRMIRAEFEEALATAGLTLAEYTALSVMVVRPGLTNARLARRSLVTPQAMVQVLSALERRGLVERTAAPEGGRARHASLTDLGHTTLDAVQPHIDTAEDRLLAGLADADRRELIRLLGQVSGLTPLDEPPR